MSTLAPGSHLERALAFFFGRDIFVSYCYEDSAYAEALAVGLGERKFSVFLGAWGASPGKKISERVKSAARQSRLLVVVATPRSRASGPVEEEIGYFAARGKPVVPIDFGLGMRNPKEEWPALAGTDVIREIAATPTAAIFERIENAAKFMRQETRLRRFLAGTAVAVIAMILGALLWAGWVVKAANDRAGKAETREQDAKKREIDATRRAGEADLLARRAKGEQRKAERDRDAAARGQREASAAAQREAEIALALRLANDATTVANQQPTLLADASLMAVDAVRRLDRHGMRALASDNAIRATAGALPVILQRKPFALTPNLAASPGTPDARFVFDWPAGDVQRIAIVDTRSGQSTPLCVPPGARVEKVALSANGTAAAIHGGGVAICRADGSLLRELPGEALSLGLDRNGETLAVTERVAQEVSTRVVRVADGGELARLPRPANTLERDLTFSASGKVLLILGPGVLVWPWTEGTATFMAPENSGAQQAFFHPTDEELIAFQWPGLQIWRWRDWKPGAAPLWSTPAEISTERRGAAFSADGQWIAASAHGALVVAHWRDQKTATIIPLHGESRTVAVENGKVAIGFRDGVTELRSLAEDTITRVTHEPVERPAPARPESAGRKPGIEAAEVVAVAFTEDGAVQSVSTSGALTWRAVPVESRLTTADVDDVAVSQDGSVVVTVTSTALGSRNHVLRVYRDGRELGPYGGAKYTSVAFDANGGLFAGTRDDELRYWKSVADLEAGKAPQIIPSVTPPVAISPSGAYQAWITAPLRRRAQAGRMEIFSEIIIAGPSGQRVHLPQRAETLAFGSDDLLVTASADGKVRAWKWRADRKRPAAVFTRRDTSFVTASRDGTWIAATGRYGEAVVWSTSGPDRPVATFPAGMSMIGFDPTAACVLTADADGIARVWSPWREARVEIARFTAPPQVKVARFSADARYLVMASRFDGVRLRMWDDAEMADEACRRLRDAGLPRYASVCRATGAR